MSQAVVKDTRLPVTERKRGETEAIMTGQKGGGKRSSRLPIVDSSMGTMWSFMAGTHTQVPWMGPHTAAAFAMTVLCGCTIASLQDASC